jgi:N-carbamoylputrescine amidase
MTNSRKYNVGLVQMRMSADPEANFAAAVERIREAARLGANIVCLPELFRTQYFCQREDLRLFDLAEPIPGPSTARSPRWPASCGSPSSPRSLSAARRGFITTRRSP